MKRLVKNRSCLVLLNSEITQKRKLRQILNELFEKSYKYFYFVNPSLASISASKTIKAEKGNVKCFCAYYYKNNLNILDFDLLLPIADENINDKIAWALKGCDAVITDYEYFDSNLKNKFSFELHKI